MINFIFICTSFQMQENLNSLVRVVKTLEMPGMEYIRIIVCLLSICKTMRLDELSRAYSLQ